MKNLIQKEEEQKNKEENIYIKNYKFQNISNYIDFFREYRALIIIKNKSENLIQLKTIKHKNNYTEVDIILYDEGINLESLIKATCFDYRTQNYLIKWILFQILACIKTLNSLNIIHRDINPQHILISKTGKITLTGFKKSIINKELINVEDKYVGKISYIAPECLLGLNYNNKIDIWSLGVLMLELFSKKTDILLNKEYNINENNKKKCLNQINLLCDYFCIDYNNKNDWISWIKKAKFDKKKFHEKFSNIIQDDDALDLLRRLLTFDPEERISANDALKMVYFYEFQNFVYENDTNINLPKFLLDLNNIFQKKYKTNEEKISSFKNLLIQICKNENI